MHITQIFMLISWTVDGRDREITAVNIVESKFKLLHNLSYGQKARFVAQLLRGPAGAWWDNYLAAQPAGQPISWQAFREAFRAHYISASLIKQKQQEFRALTHGNRMVMQYVQTFLYLSRYSLVC